MSARRPVSLPDQPVRLAQYRVDWGRLRLEHDEVSTKLTPKAGAVLALMLREPGVTVPRATFFDVVWPGSFSSDDVLTQVVQELRRAFADREREPAWIVTVPKLGYRWEGPLPLPDAPAAVVPALPPVAAMPVATVGEAKAAAAPKRSRWLLAALATACVAIALLLWDRGRAPAVPAGAAAPASRPLLREPAQELAPDLAQDGRRLVYVRYDAGHFELRLREFRTGSESVLVAATTMPIDAPRFSADGARIAYLRRAPERCELRTVALDGADDRVVVADCPRSLPTSVEWSADGASLFYTRIANGDALAQRSLAIHRIDARGGAPRRISDAGRWLSVDAHPRRSGERELVFVRDGEGKHRVVRVSVDGGDETEIEFPLWPYRVAAYGDGLVLSAHGRSGLELWRADRDGRLREVLARDGAGPGFALDAAGRLVYERHRADDNLWRMDLSGALAAPEARSSETGSELEPRVAPDGGSIAYLSDASGDLEVHRRAADGSVLGAWSALAPRVPLDLRWSPDGTRMALIVGTADGKRIMLLEADGGLAELPQSLAAVVPAQLEWHRDGDLWIAAERDGRRQLLRARAPDFARIELVVDRAVASFALDGDDVLLLTPAGEHFERLDGTVLEQPLPIARPPDQWSWRDGRIAQLVQRGGEPGRLVVHAVGHAEPQIDFLLPLPEPPLGRHLDLGGGELWYARRDRVESDLYELRAPLSQ